MRISGILLAIAIAASPAFGQTFPEKPVRIVVPQPPGGGFDLAARVIDRKSTRLNSSH